MPRAKPTAPDGASTPRTCCRRRCAKLSGRAPSRCCLPRSRRLLGSSASISATPRPSATRRGWSRSGSEQPSSGAAPDALIRLAEIQIAWKRHVDAERTLERARTLLEAPRHVPGTARRGAPEPRAGRSGTAADAESSCDLRRAGSSSRQQPSRPPDLMVAQTLNDLAITRDAQARRHRGRARILHRAIAIFTRQRSRQSRPALTSTTSGRSRSHSARVGGLEVTLRARPGGPRSAGAPRMTSCSGPPRSSSLTRVTP